MSIDDVTAEPIREVNKKTDNSRENQSVRRSAEPSSLPDTYIAIELEQDQLMIYDRDRPRAWIRSDDTVPGVRP